MRENEPSPRGYHHGDLRNALIAAGRAILAEEGTAGLDLRKVARRAGVSHTAPYRHFADKQALLAAIAEDGFQELYRRLADTRGRAGPATAARLEAIGLAYFDFATERPAHMREMFSGLTIDRQEHRDLYAASKQSFQLLASTLAEGQVTGEVCVGDPTELAIIVWSQIHGATMLLLERQIAMEGANEPHDIIRRAIQRLSDGLRPRA